MISSKISRNGSWKKSSFERYLWSFFIATLSFFDYVHSDIMNLGFYFYNPIEYIFSLSAAAAADFLLTYLFNNT